MIPLFLAEDEENSSSMARQRVFRDLNDPLDCYDDLELVQRFRFSRSSISKITDLIDVHLNFTQRSRAAPPHLQVCVALQFFASGTFQIICGDGANVSQSSASRYIHDVAQGLQDIYHQFVSMPNPSEKVEVKNKFYEIAHLPGVLGLVDGTHIRIQKPHDNEADYVNRHFYHSINVQAICQPDGKFSDVLARYPGSVHDSRIWKLSLAGKYIENNFAVGEHILGDSGYMLRPYLLTPYRQPGSTSQSNYNYAHKRTRVVIEQTFGRWKRRFHCLHGEIRMNPDKVCTIIVACAVLHNMAILWKQPLPLLQDEFSDISYPDDLFELEETGQLAAKHYRDRFAIHNFS